MINSVKELIQSKEEIYNSQLDSDPRISQLLGECSLQFSRPNFSQFSRKAEEEKARWKASRDAEAAREYAKIEAEKHLKKKRILIDKPSGETVLNQEKAEAPKRTIRRWKPPPPDPSEALA